MSEPADVITKLYEAKQYARLYDYCNAILQEDPGRMLALQNGALACMHLGLYKEALALCQKVLGMEPQDAYALRHAAWALECLHRHDEALDMCRQILDIDARDVWAMNGAGLALAELNRHEEAAGYFERSLHLEPRNPTALMNGALALERTGRAREAVALYDRALQLDTPIREAAGARARAYRSLGMDDEAFLAAQGITDDHIRGIIRRARNNRCSLLHQLCLEEMDGYGDRDPHADNPFRP